MNVEMQALRLYVWGFNAHLSERELISFRLIWCCILRILLGFKDLIDIRMVRVLIKSFEYSL